MFYAAKTGHLGFSNEYVLKEADLCLYLDWHCFSCWLIVATKFSWRFIL